MPSTAEQVKSIVLKHKGSASKQQIARELKMGLGYIDFICRDLERKRELVFRDGLYFLMTADYKLPKRRTRVIHRKYKQKNLISNVYTKSAFLSPKMTKELTKVLRGAGYKTIESLAEAPIARLMQETNLKLYEAAGLINQARRRVVAMAEHGKKSAK